MGGTNSKPEGLQDTFSFKPDKVHHSVVKKIKGLHIDESLLPQAGIFVVGTEYVECYSEAGTNLVASHRCPSPIISSSINYSNCKHCTIIAVACQDNCVYLFNSTTLFELAQINVSFKPEDIELPDYNIKCKENKYLEKVRLDCILTPFQDSILVGFSNGFVKEYSLNIYEPIKVYNPVPLLYKKENNEKREILIEEAVIPGILSINYGETSEYIFVNHKRNLHDLQDQVITLEDTPISVYKHNGEAVKQFKVKGDILAGKVLENRTLYICLSSINSELSVFNFSKGALIMKVSLDIMKNPEAPMYFTGMTLNEFEMGQRLQPVETILSLNTPSKEVIDGDFIFAVESSGSILINKLGYEGETGKIAFTPLKYINAKGDGHPKNNTVLVSRMVYSKAQDQLLFSDQNSEVVVISNILKKVFAGSVEAKK